MSGRILITPEVRTALRQEIKACAAWTSAFRNKHGFSFADMKRDDYFRCCELLGLDIAAISARVIAERGTTKASDGADHNWDAGTETSDAAPEAKAEFVRKHDASNKPFAPDDAQPREPKTVFPATTTKERATMLANSDNGAAGNRLAALIAELASSTVDADMVRAIVAEEIEKADLGSSQMTRIRLVAADGKAKDFKGTAHPKFATLLRACSAREVSGYAPNCWIAGPAGSGKTFAANQVARALDIPFHFNGAVGMTHELLGFIDAAGTYHRTAFREAYEHGGVYLFDEVDGSDNAALLALNAALANGFATFPDGTIKRHADCRIIAAANTWGSGATADYVGRAKIDAAFLSRFPVKIVWNYDEELERATCGDERCAVNVQIAREAARHIGLKVLITPRDSAAMAALVASGCTIVEAAEMTYLATLSDDQRTMLETKMIELRKARGA